MDASFTSADPPRDLSSHSLAIAEHAPLPMATVEGSTHRVCYANPAFCQLMGAPMKDLLGRPLSALLPHKDECVTLLDLVSRTGEPASHTEKAQSKSHPVFWSYTMWPVQEGLLVGTMIQVTETAKRHSDTVAMNEALILGSLRQHVLMEEAEQLNAALQKEICAREKIANELSKKARLLDLTHDAIIVRDMDGHVLYWNHGAEELFGWTREEALGQVSNVLLQTEFPISLEQMSEELYRTNRWTGELVHTTRDGRRLIDLTRKTLDRDNLGNPVAVLENISDITERKQAEEAVRAAGERFQFMAESMPQKIFTATATGVLDYYNQQWMEFTGLSCDQIRNWGWTQFVHTDDLEENISQWKHSIETGEYFEIEHRIRRHDGQYRWHVSRAHVMRDAAGNITMWIGSNTDIDDVMKAQVELMEAETQLADRAVHLETLVSDRTAELSTAHAQLLKEAEARKRLEAEIAGAIEGERERLGQELHDGLVQELTGIAMMLTVLERKLVKRAPKEAGEAHRLCQLMEKAHSNVRDLAKSFYPVELEQHGLVAALEGIAQRTRQQFGVKCSVEAGLRTAAGVKDATSVQLLRIAQEAVQNAVKHAHAREIVIHLSKQNGSWLLTVRDDGTGLGPDVPETGGMGLRIMQYRARIIQGTLSVADAAGGGVLVSCVAPAGKFRQQPLNPRASPLKRRLPNPTKFP